jgi:hypothetical protein
MSVNETKTITCPHCQHEQSVQIWQSLNVALDHETKKELFEGRLNLLVCEYCGKKTFIPVPLLYHDPGRQIAAQYYPPGVIRDHKFLGQFRSDGAFVVSDTAGLDVPEYMRHIHIVFNMDELVTYIVFREVLFDYHRTGRVELN